MWKKKIKQILSFFSNLLSVNVFSLAMSLFVLFESASGYALFERKEFDEIAGQGDEFQRSLLDISKFSKILKLKAFMPFQSAADALANINCVSEGIVPDTLKNFLEMNFPKSSKRSQHELGVGEEKLAGSIQDACSIKCVKNQLVLEILRAIRLHFDKCVGALKEGDLEKAQLGLGHSYSRCKVKFNVNRADNMIIQSIALLDQLNKDINTFAMRVKEWYAYHYPELSTIVKDNIMYAKVAFIIQSKDQLKSDVRERLEEVTMDSALTEKILSSIKSSMGQDISPVDLINICSFSERVISLDKYRTELEQYLKEKMHNVAPNLASLIGDTVGARLISHAGSLTNLAKYPASTTQILGAEKALFRALKTRGNTPKYGLIYHSTFIGRASVSNKGRISRYLANKCSIASRIDCFSEESTDKFGLMLRDQVEERLSFYENGEAPRKNIDAMREVLTALKSEGSRNSSEVKKETKGIKESKRKRSESNATSAVSDISMEDVSEKKKRKKEKKSKEDKKELKKKEKSDGEKTPRKEKSKKEKKVKKEKK
jgi:nucleolar protein 56